MLSLRIAGVLFALSLVVAGCGRAPGREAMSDSSGMGSSDSAEASKAKAPMTAMPMLPKLRAQLDSVAANPAMLKGSMSDHQAEVRAVVDAMHADMTAAGMHSDAAYEALADSVVKGSVALSTASGPDFDRMVTMHVDQMRRLAAVYESMVKGM